MGTSAVDASAATIAGPTLKPVVLRGYPVRLGKRQMQHYDELLRELSLVMISRQSRPEELHAPQRLFDLIDVMLTQFGAAVESGAQQREAAYARGDTTTTLEYQVVPESRDVVAAFLEIMTEVDDFCRSGELLTLATPEDLLALRRWSVTEFIRQLDGEAPTPWEGPLD